MFIFGKAPRPQGVTSPRAEDEQRVPVGGGLNGDTLFIFAG